MGKNPIHANPLSDEKKAEIFFDAANDEKQSVRTIADGSAAADRMLQAYVDAFLRENRLKSCVSRGIFWRRILFASVYALLLFLIFAIHCLYHTAVWLIVIGFTVLPVVYVVLLVNNNTKKWLFKEVKKRPSDSIDNILASQVSGAKRGPVSFIAQFALPVLALVLAAIVFWNPHIIYEKNSNFGYSVRYYTLSVESEYSIEIPETYKGRPVNEIRGSTFTNMSFRRITLPSALTEIRGNTFEGCSELLSITIPKGVTRIGGSAFEDCKSLQTIELPSGLKEIGGSAFRGCTSLKNISLWETELVRLGTSAFRGCRSLVVAELPPTVTTLGDSVFRDCPRLKAVYLPKNATWGKKVLDGSALNTFCQYSCDPDETKDKIHEEITKHFQKLTNGSGE